MALFPPSSGAAGLATVINVINYGADPTGLSDSTAAFMRAIAAADSPSEAQGSRSAIFVPQGGYKISDELMWQTAMHWFGEGPASRIFAASNMASKYIFGGQAAEVFPTIFSGFALYNQYAQSSAGGCIRSNGPVDMVDLTIENCYMMSGGDCIHSDVGKVFVLNVSDCTFRGIPFGGNNYGGRGIACYVSGGTIRGNDLSLLESAVLVSGAGSSMLGNRLESNWRAYVIGESPAGVTVGMINSCIKGSQFEANGTAVEIVNANGCSFENFYCQGELQGPLGGISSQYGIVASGQNSYRNVVATGDYLKAAWEMRGGPAVIENCVTANDQPMPAFSLRCPMSDITFVGRGLIDSSNPSALPVNYCGGPTRSLSKYTATSTMVQGENLSGSVAVGAAASTVDVAFLVGLACQDMIFSTTAGSGGSLSQNVTYYYVSTIINELGEMGTHTEHAVAMGSNTKVTVVTLGISSPPGPGATTYKRRLYRGRAPDTYDGYYEQAGGSATFVDTGSAFTGYKAPPIADLALPLPSGAEPDAGYSVVGIETDWNTGGWWITAKATTGFTVNFANAAPGGGGNVGWLITR